MLFSPRFCDQALMMALMGTGSAADLLRELVACEGGERLARAAARARALGGDLGWLGDNLAAWQADHRPDKRRLHRRDAALVALAAHCEPGSDRELSGQILRAIGRYESSRWAREQMMTEAPAIYGAQGAALFAVMRESGAKTGSPGLRTI